MGVLVPLHQTLAPASGSDASRDREGAVKPPAEPRVHWDNLAAQAAPSWYLDPVVAAQKRRVHQDLVWRWTRGLDIGRVLKTDVFEEAHGTDQILFDLFPEDVQVVGLDLAWQTAHRAKDRNTHRHAGFAVSDVRSMAVATGSVDAIVSTSTLDHLGGAADFTSAVREFARVLRPGGVAVITLDNPTNPLYPLLAWASRRGWAPFALGYTAALPRLVRHLEQAGLEVTATGTLIHNPRMISTLLFLGLRRLLGRRADAPIRLLLAAFAALGRLPSHRLTACFNAVRARKPER